MKTDFRKEHKALYTGARRPALIEVPPLQYLMIDGSGAPAAPGYADAVSKLYGVAYTIRFALKKAGIVEYPVMPLQGQWWSADPDAFTADDRSGWQWTMMIMQPPQVTAEVVTDAMEALQRKRKPADGVRLSVLEEGPAIQVLHVGAYADEWPTIKGLLEFGREHGHQITGKHHEIYLTPPNPDAPTKMRTLIRYPITPSHPS